MTRQWSFRGTTRFGVLVLLTVTIGIILPLVVVGALYFWLYVYETWHFTAGPIGWLVLSLILIMLFHHLWLRVWRRFFCNTWHITRQGGRLLITFGKRRYELAEKDIHTFYYFRELHGYYKGMALTLRSTTGTVKIRTNTVAFIYGFSSDEDVFTLNDFLAGFVLRNQNQFVRSRNKLFKINRFMQRNFAWKQEFDEDWGIFKRVQ